MKKKLLDKNKHKKLSSLLLKRTNKKKIQFQSIQLKWILWSFFSHSQREIKSFIQQVQDISIDARIPPGSYSISSSQTEMVSVLQGCASLCLWTCFLQIIKSSETFRLSLPLSVAALCTFGLIHLPLLLGLSIPLLPKFLPSLDFAMSDWENGSLHQRVQRMGNRGCREWRNFSARIELFVTERYCSGKDCQYVFYLKKKQKHVGPLSNRELIHLPARLKKTYFYSFSLTVKTERLTFCQ